MALVDEKISDGNGDNYMSKTIASAPFLSLRESNESKMGCVSI